MFYTVPYSLYDPEPTREMLVEAGFGQIEVTKLAKEGTSPSAAEAAIGLVAGTPILGAIMERGPDSLEAIKRATAAAVAAELGDPPVPIPLNAFVFRAQRL